MTAEMTTEARGRKRDNRIYRRMFHWFIPGAACMVMLWAGSVMLAGAVPATLGSSSATIYERPGEGSNAVGNLVQDGAFEYLGDVTGEDGSTWHQVSAGGVSGYIKGEAVIREEDAGGEQEETPEEGEVPEEAAAEEIPEQAPLEAPAVQQPEQAEDAEETPEEEEEMPEEEEEEPDEGTDLLTVQTLQNNRAKTYAAGALGGRIKELEGTRAGEDAEELGSADGEKRPHGLDKTMLLAMAATVFFAAAAHFFWKKLRLESRGAEEEPEHALAGAHKKSDKKRKKNRRRKNRKKIKNKKEVMKTQKTLR